MLFKKENFTQLQHIKHKGQHLQFGKFRNPDSLRLTSLRRAFLLADRCRRRCLLEGAPRLERRSRPDLDRGLRPVSGRVSKVGSGVPAWVLLFEPVALGVWCDIFVFGCVCRLLSQNARLLICLNPYSLVL